MMKNTFLLIGIMFSNFCVSQIENDSTTKKKLVEITLTASRVSKEIELLSNQTEVISKDIIEFQNFQSTAELLSNSGSLFVQKSQQGGGSPVIRGFEASRVLLLVDVFRQNNLIFRSGHLQNVISVDENLLENVTVFFGPTSTLYGSDALGGSVNMLTKNPIYFTKSGKEITGAITTRYGSVNEEKSVSFDFTYAKNNFAALTVFSFNEFGDLRMGRRKNHYTDYFGERPIYQNNVDGIDILVTNENKYLQVHSGFKQYNVLQKFLYKTISGFEHGINLQYSTTTDIPRYDRLTNKSGSGLEFGDWYYGPQKRILMAYTLSKEKIIFDSNFKLNVGFQNTAESRHNRKFGKPELKNREESVNMFSIAADFDKKFAKSELFYGIESYYETLSSEAFAQNIKTGEVKGLDTRYPNGKNSMTRNDLYISYNEKLNSQTTWNTGGRIGYTTLNSSIANDTYFPLPFSSIKQRNITYSGSLGIVHSPSQNATLKSNLASGFRVPNIDDVAKIFDSGNGYLIVPNANLEPEKTITADLGLLLQTDSKKFKLENTYFYTRMYDALVTAAFMYQGQTTVNGDVVLANQNQGRSYVTGLSTNFEAELIKNLKLNATFNYTLGRIVEIGSEKPLDHIAPYYGKIGVSYSKKWASFELYMLYNGKKQSKDYNLNGEDNQKYAPADGMPAWETYNLKTSFTIFKEATLYMGLENMLDTQYRVFASGINSPGINIYGGLKYQF